MKAGKGFHVAQVADSYCRNRGLSPREACKTIGVVCTPLLLFQMNEAMEVAGLHSAWERANEVGRKNGKSAGEIRMKLYESPMFEHYVRA